MGTNQEPGKKSLTPVNGLMNYLWISATGFDGYNSVTAYSLPDNNISENSNGTGPCSVAISTDELRQVSLNPAVRCRQAVGYHRNIFLYPHRFALLR